MSAIRLILGGMMALVLVGCATHPDGVHVPCNTDQVFSSHGCVAKTTCGSDQKYHEFSNSCSDLWKDWCTEHASSDRNAPGGYLADIPPADLSVMQTTYVKSTYQYLAPVPAAQDLYVRRCVADSAGKQHYLQERSDRQAKRRAEKAAADQVMKRYGLTPQ